MFIADVSPKDVGTVDPAPYVTGGKTIRQAQLEYLQARMDRAQEEFLQVPKKKSNASFHLAGQHMDKNRYRDILPYDDNVVRLRASSDGTSYINASYVTFPTLSTKSKPCFQRRNRCRSTKTVLTAASCLSKTRPAPRES